MTTGSMNNNYHAYISSLNTEYKKVRNICTVDNLETVQKLGTFVFLSNLKKVK
jgi:hypothetical protein